jgi:hypothetical protein
MPAILIGFMVLALISSAAILYATRRTGNLDQPMDYTAAAPVNGTAVPSAVQPILKPADSREESISIVTEESGTCCTKNPKATPDMKNVGEETLYDISGNVFIGGETETKPSVKESEGKQETPPLDTLKAFYDKLPEENLYEKAMELLDDDFKLELAMLNQFGVEQLGKKDIDMEQVQVYSDILRAARLENIVSTKLDGNSCTIFYYQVFDTGDTIQDRMPMEAQLKKSGDVWKIFFVKDGNPGLKPFVDEQQSNS